MISASERSETHGAVGPDVLPGLQALSMEAVAASDGIDAIL